MYNLRCGCCAVAPRTCSPACGCAFELPTGGHATRRDSYAPTVPTNFLPHRPITQTRTRQSAHKPATSSCLLLPPVHAPRGTARMMMPKVLTTVETISMAQGGRPHVQSHPQVTVRRRTNERGSTRAWTSGTARQARLPTDPGGAFLGPHAPRTALRACTRLRARLRDCSTA